MAKKAKSRKTDETVRNDLIDALFRVAETKGWRRLKMDDIAAEAGCETAQALRHFASPAAVLCGAIGRADRCALDEAADFTDADTPRDRLFALLMARFDAMAPHKAGAKALLRDGLCDPAFGMTVAARGLCSMMRMLEAAGVRGRGPVGLMRAKGLALVNAYAVRVWLIDDSEDAAKTMAALDKGLARAEAFAQSFDPAARCRRARSSDTSSETA